MLKRVVARGRPDDSVNLMLDSGAYSAWNQPDAEPISLREYIEYIKRNERWVRWYVNLDTIAEERGRNRSDECLEAAAEQSDRNLQTMLDAGLHPIPVFHEGEDWYWLEKLLKDGHNYIGLAPIKPPRQESVRFLDAAFAMLKGSSVMTHGFGITKPEWLLNPKFKFTSVDSTTWSMGAGYYAIYVPPMGDDGAPDYTGLPERVVVSRRPQKSASLRRRQFDVLDCDTQDYVRRYIESAGFELEDTRGDDDPAPHARRTINLRYFMNLTRDLPVTVFYATQIEQSFAKPLMKLEARDQLVSYFKLRNRDDKVLQRYVEAGMIWRPLQYFLRLLRKPSYWDDRTRKLAERLARYEAEGQGL